jgi:glycosyltransferase involved in cell wall biosynthesis
MNSKDHRSVLYVGQAYYNHWYLSRELRKLGWKADQLNLETNEKSAKYYHGEDVSFANSSYKETYKKLEYYLYALANYKYFHFANQFGIYFISDFDHLAEKNRSGFKKFVLRFFLDRVVKKRVSVLFRVFYFLGPKRSTRMLKYFAGALPERWDIYLLKYFDKRIIYTNNGCHDGATKKTFQKWLTPTNEPICHLCPLFESNECNDENNNKWGKFRNSVVSYQSLLGSNRIDYNVHPTAHENPWNYCLDKNVWSPQLLIPANLLLPIPKETIKIYHAVGNFESRLSHNKSIKSTHIYVPLINKLKAEGYNVELIFFKDVPNQTVRYYQSQADIFVDMLSYGFFGATIREGMMLGKPCICYLRPEWLEDMKKEIPGYVDELPVVSANEHNIEEVLIDLIKNKSKREEIGKRSRAFAEKWHASDVAAVKMAEIYQSLQD